MLGIGINMPPIADGRKEGRQFSVRECAKGKKIASARVHVERANYVLKNWRILDVIPYQFRGEFLDQIVRVVAALTNLQSPILREVNDSLTNLPVI
jgi:hypothetical protein